MSKMMWVLLPVGATMFVSLFWLFNRGGSGWGMAAAILVLALFVVLVRLGSNAAVDVVALGIAFVAGQALAPVNGASWPGVLSVAASALLILFAAAIVLKARSRPVVNGREELIGSVGKVLGDINGTDGWARVHGEVWRIRCNQPLRRGQEIRAVRMAESILEVEPDVEGYRLLPGNDRPTAVVSRQITS